MGQCQTDHNEFRDKSTETQGLLEETEPDKFKIKSDEELKSVCGITHICQWSQQWLEQLLPMAEKCQSETSWFCFLSNLNLTCLSSALVFCSELKDVQLPRYLTMF